jgi:hypothetical protein
MTMMANHVEPADAYEAFLDATVGIEPALIEAEPQQAPADRCVVDDDHKADWALRKLAQLDAWKRQRAAFVAAEMERLQTWQAHEDCQAEHFAAYLTALLQPYDDQLKAEGKVSARHEGYRLPHGTLTARLAPIEWEVDEATLLAWADATDPEMLVRVTKAPAWNVLKPQLIPARDEPLAEATIEVIDPRTGEVRAVSVPGVRVKRGPHEVFTPKPAWPHELMLIAVKARVGLVSGARRAMYPGTTGPLAIDTTTGEVLAGTRVDRLPHNSMTIEALDEGPTGGDP